MYADFQLGTKLTVAEQRKAAAKARLHGRAAALAFLDDVERRRAEGAVTAETRGIEAGAVPGRADVTASGSDAGNAGNRPADAGASSAGNDRAADQDRR